MDREIQDRFLCSGRRIDQLELLFCSSISFLCRQSVGRPLASNSAKALQRAAESLLFKLPLAAAVQSSGPDPNKFVDYSPAPALPARRTFRSDSAANVQAPRAGAQANRYVKQPLDASMYVHVFKAEIPTKYMQIHAYIDQ